MTSPADASSKDAPSPHDPGDEPPRAFGEEAVERLREALDHDSREDTDPERRSAAVLVPLYVHQRRVHVVLTRRTDTLRHHRGQVSFPGGGWEEGDRDLCETALREAHEEVGLDPRDVEVLGVLGDMPTAVSGYVIRPFVGRIPAGYRFVRQPGEVARVFTPPLELFADPDLRREETWERDGVRFPVTFFDVDGEVVWGATARLMLALLDVLAGREPGTARIPPPPEPG